MTHDSPATNGSAGQDDRTVRGQAEPRTGGRTIARREPRRVDKVRDGEDRLAGRLSGRPVVRRGLGQQVRKVQRADERRTENREQDDEDDESADGRQGLDRLAQGGIDAIALDQYMPGLDGLETLEQILAIRLRIPVHPANLVENAAVVVHQPDKIVGKTLILQVGEFDNTTLVAP